MNNINSNASICYELPRFMEIYNIVSDNTLSILSKMPECDEYYSFLSDIIQLSSGSLTFHSFLKSMPREGTVSTSDYGTYLDILHNTHSSSVSDMLNNEKLLISRCKVISCIIDERIRIMFDVLKVIIGNINANEIYMYRLALKVMVNKLWLSNSKNGVVISMNACRLLGTYNKGLR